MLPVLDRQPCRGSHLRRVLMCAIAVSMVLRIALVASVANTGVHTDDERDYVGLATSLRDGRGFASAAGPTSIRPPLYPAFVAGVWGLSGADSLTAVRGAQIGLSGLTVWLVFLLARRMFSEQTALLAAAAWSWYPSFLYANVLLLTEVLFTTTVLAACVAASQLIDSPRRAGWWAAGIGVSVGLAALTRSILYPFPIVLLPLVAWLEGGSWSRRGGVAACAALGYLVVVTPWAIRNTNLQKTIVVVDAMGGLNLRMGNFEHTLEERMWDGVSLKGQQSWSYAMVAEHPEASYWTEGQRDRWARDRAIAYMRDNPGTTLRRAALKFADFWGLEREYIAALKDGAYPLAPLWFQWVSSGAVLIVYVLTMLLACVGFAVIPREHYRHHVVPLTLVLFVCALHSIVFGHSRYHLPLMPVLTIYAAAAATARLGAARLLSCGTGRFALGAMTVLATIWAHEVLFRDGARIRHFLGIGV